MLQCVQQIIKIEKDKLEEPIVRKYIHCLLANLSYFDLANLRSLQVIFYILFHTRPSFPL